MSSESTVVPWRAMDRGRAIQVREPNQAAKAPMFYQTQIASITGGSFNYYAGDVTNYAYHWHAAPTIMNNVADDPITTTVSELERFVQTTIGDFRAIHDDILASKTRGSGESLKARPEVQDWWRSIDNILWITGGPGTGKTFLASSFVEWFEKETEAQPNAHEIVIYAYLRHHEPLGQSDIILKLVIQLAQGSPDLPQVAVIISSFLEPYIRKRNRPAFHEVVNLFNYVVGLFQRVTIIVDGIDEMRSTIRWSILETLSTVNAKILFTSRPLKAEENQLQELSGRKVISVDFMADSEDLERFIRQNVQQAPSLARILKEHNQLDEVVTNIKTKADGMFLHAWFQVEELRSCRNLRSVHDAITEFPAEIGGMYALTVTRITSGSRRDVDLANRILIWVVYSQWPLTLAELQHAVSVSPETRRFEADRMYSEIDMLSVCSGLLAVESGTQLVRLRHHSAYEVLPGIMSKPDIVSKFQLLPDLEVAMTCMSRLRDCGFQATEFKRVGQLKEKLEGSPLLGYADAYLRKGIHTVTKRPENISSVNTIVETFVAECRGYPYANIFERHFSFLSGPYADWEPESDLHILTPLHLAAASNLPHLVTRILANGGEQSTLRAGHPHDLGITSLMLAARAGHTEIMDVLVKEGHLEVNIFDEHHQTALNHACYSSLSDVVMKLLDLDPDVHHNDELGRSILSRACYFGYDNVVDHLLSRPDIDPTLGDDSHDFPLMLAVRQGHSPIVDVLLRRGAWVNQMNIGFQTALMEASWAGHLEIVRTLLNVPEVNANHCSKDGSSALTLATFRGNNEVVKVLLEAGVDINHPDIHGQSPLLCAADLGHLEIVRTLLNFPGVNTAQVLNNSLTSALALAARSGHNDVVKTLLEAKLDANQLDCWGCNPLMIASESGHLEVVRALLDVPGINTSQVDRQGNSAMILAAQNRHTEVVKTLLEARPDTNEWCSSLLHAARLGHLEVVCTLLVALGGRASQAKDNGSSALALATQNGHTEVVKAFLDAGMDVNEVDNGGCSPLLLASQNGHLPIVHTLLKVPGITKSQVDNKGYSALALAAANGHNEVVKLLLGAGLDVNQLTHRHSSPLLLALQYSQLQCIDTLLAVKGVNKNQVDNDGESALLYMALGGFVQAVDFFIAAGGDVNRANHHGHTPLTYASSHGHRDVVQHLLAISDIEINHQTQQGLTAVMWAAYRGQNEVVQMIMDDARANLAFISGQDESVLLLVLSSHLNRCTDETWQYHGPLDPQPTALLLLNHPDVQKLAHRPCNEGWTPLLRAAMFGFKTVVEKLLQIPGCDINRATKDGKTSVDVALEGGHDDILKLLEEWLLLQRRA